MRKIKKVFFSVVVCAILIVSAAPVFSFASCSHSSLGPLYCEATHPHEYYNKCTLCGVKIYTGEYATKDHGDGTWGSWTCPDCGTHTYVGRTCTEEGICACGATIAAYGHLYNSTVAYEDAHPHRAYITCIRCSVMSYTGSTETREHGDGSNGTCELCGDHSYSPVATIQNEHPHEQKMQCNCGDTKYWYALEYLCTSCRAGTRTATNSATASGNLLYFEGNEVDYGIPLSCPVTLVVTYTNVYNHPYPDLSTTYAGYPVFASFHSVVSTTVESLITGPEVMSSATLTPIPYYDAQGNIIREQSISMNENNEAIGTVGMIFGIMDTNPAYTIVSGGCNILGSGFGDSVFCDVTTYFN